MKSHNNDSAVRLDKWLWAARFYKTRSLANEAIKSGKIKLNGHSPKTGKTVVVSDELLIKKTPYEFHIVIKQVGMHRRPASEAALMYEESDASKIQRETLAQQLKAESVIFPRTQGRPTKRDRRQIIRFKDNSS